LVDHPGDQERSVLLVGAGSSRSDAAAELAEAGRLLGVRLGRAVAVATLGEDVRARVAELAPVTVATYLLAEGHFYDTLRSAVAGLAPLASPLGVHPALIRLIWSRYDET
jgi:sirohydrochlorin ferrochelatase